MEKTLAEWEKILHKEGFSSKYYDYLDSELISVSWYNGDEHIKTECHHTEEYNKYLSNFKNGTEFETDWNQCIVDGVIIYTPEFGYPRGDIFDDKWNGQIRLSEYNNEYINFHEFTMNNFYKALRMSRNPIQAKIEICKKFISECETLFKEKGPILKRMGFKQNYCSLLDVGNHINTITEPDVSFKHPDIYNIELNLFYNMFTGKLFARRIVPSNDFNIIVYQDNVNDISDEEFKNILNNFLKYKS